MARESIERPGYKDIERERSGKKSLFKTVLGTGLMMIGWGIGLKVSKGVSHLVNRKLGVAAFKWALSDRSPSHRFVNSVFNRAQRFISKQYTGDRGAAVAEKLRNMRSIYTKRRDDVARSITRIKQSYGRATGNYAQTRYWMGKADSMIDNVGFSTIRRVPGVRSVRKVSHLQSKDIRATSVLLNLETLKKRPFIRAINKVRTSKALLPGGDMFAKASAKRYQLGGVNFNEAMKARLYRYSVNLAAGAPFEYAAYRMMVRDKDKKWYSGEAIGDWMKFRVGGDIVFGGAFSKGAGAALRAVKKRIVLPRVTKPFIDKMLGGLEKVSRSAVVTSLSDTTRDIRFIGKPTSVKNIGKWSSEIAKSFRKHYHSYRGMSPMDRPTAATSAVNDAVKFIQEMQIKKKDDSASVAMKILTAHKNLYTHLKSEDPNKALSKINWMFKKMGTAPKGARSGTIRDAIKKFRFEHTDKKTGDVITDVFMRSVAGESKNLPQYFVPRKGVIEFGGNVYDLSNIMPSNTSKSVAGLLGSFSVFGLRPFKLLGMTPYTSIEDEFFMRRYTAGTKVYVGPMKPEVDLHTVANSIKKARPTSYTIKVKDDLYKMKLFNRGVDDVLLAGESMKSLRVLPKGRGTAQQRVRKFANEMRTGHIDLVGSEEAWYVGKNIYYTPDAQAKKLEVFQMGIDWTKNKYHSFDVLTREHAGGLGILSNVYHGVGMKPPHKMKRRMKDTDGWFSRQVHKFQDLFDLGTYDKPSVFNRVGHLFRRFHGMNQPRVYFSEEGVFNPEMISSIKAAGPTKVKNLFVKNTRQHLRNMQKDAVDTVFSRREYITAVKAKMKSAGIANVDPNDSLLILDQNRNKTYSEVVDFIKKDARDLFGIKGKKLQQAAVSPRSAGGRYLSGDEIDFVNALFRERDPTKAIANLTFTGVRQEKYNILKKYDTIRVKTYLGSMKAQELDEVMGGIVERKLLGKTRRAERAFDIVKLFNSDLEGPTLDELMNNRDVKRISGDLLTRYDRILKNNKALFMDYSKRADPIWKLRGSPIVTNYDRNLNMGDVFISRGMTSEGESIDSFFRSIMPRTYTREGMVFPEAPITKGALTMMGAINAINNTAAAVGLGFSPEHMRTPLMFMKNVMTRRVLPAVALGAAWRVADATIDESLDYNEFILVRHKHNWQMELRKIGELVDTSEWSQYQALSNHNGDVKWRDITGGHKHIRKSQLTSTKTKAGAEVLVTTSHSLFTGTETNLRPTIPEVGKHIVALDDIKLLTADLGTSCGSDSRFVEYIVLCDLPGSIKYVTGLNSKNIQRIRHGKNLTNDEKWIREYVKYRKGGITSNSETKYEVKGFKHWVCSGGGLLNNNPQLTNRVRVRYKGERASLPIKIKLEDVAWLIGLYVAEGSSWREGKNAATTSIAVTEGKHKYKGDIYNRIVEVITELCGYRPRNNNEELKIPGKIWYEFWKLIGTGVHAINKKVPMVILNATNATKREFLRGYFEGDGYWNKETSEVHFTTVSRELAVGIVLLLKSLGVKNVWVKYEKHEEDNRSDVYRVCTREYKPTNYVHLREFGVRNSGRRPYKTFSGKIKEVIPTIKQPYYVYDISVDEAENFVGGIGLVYIHNSGLFEGTALGQGLNVFMAEQMGKGRLGMARLNDIFGVTDSARYLENLMPGSVSSPLAGALRGFGFPLLGSALGAAKGGPRGGLLGGAIGLGLSVLTAGGPLAMMGNYDLTKSRADIIEEYSGRKQIPVYRGAGWLLSSSPYGGTGVEFYKPSWFHLARSQFRYTDVLYGSKWERLASTFNPRHYMEKHKYTRPYPFGGEVFANIPLIGNIARMGGDLQNYPEMEYQLGATEEGVNYSPSMQTMGIMAGMDRKTVGSTRPFSGFVSDPTTLSALEPQPMVPTDMPARIGSAFYGASEFAGLRGFMTQSLYENFSGGMFPYEGVPVFQSASLMTSPIRSWWDQIPNDPLGCFVAGTKTQTNRGKISIEEVIVGDCVLSDGVMRKVINIARYYNKKVRRLKISNIGQELIGTEQHKIPVFKRIPCRDNHNRPCRPGARNHCRVCGLRNIDMEPRDTPLVDIKPNDYVAVPLIQTNNDPVSTIDLCDYVDRTHTDKYIYMTKHPVYAYAYEVLEEYGPEYKTESIKRRIKEKYGDIYTEHSHINDARRKMRQNKALHRWDRYIDIDADMLYIMGWWVAEGSKKTKQHGLVFTMNNSEIDYASRLANIIDDKFGCKSHINKVKETQALRLETSAYSLSKIMSLIFGRGAHNKHIPHFIKEQPLHLLRYFFEGLILGDGWLSDRTKQGGFTSVSRTLVEDVFQIALRFGICGSMLLDYEENVDGKLLPQGVEQQNKTRLRSNIQWRNQAYCRCVSLFRDGIIIDGYRDILINDHFHFYKGNVYFKVKSNAESHIADVVYDLTIEDKHYYTANMLLVHNTMEYVRRFVPKRGEHTNELNPIVNAMPGWVPGAEGFVNFQGGDPFVKVRLGEVRLPGSGYESTHDVKFTVPLETEYVGMSPGEALMEMTGQAMPVDPDKRYDRLLSGKMAQQIGQTLSANNAAVKTNHYVFNPLLNMSGKFDIVIGNQNGMKVKVVSPETYKRIDQPRREDIGEMNALLNLSKNVNFGTIIYVDAASGETKEFQAMQDPHRFQRDVTRTMEVKDIAFNMIAKHGPKVGKGLGNAYSRADRLAILADVAPYSEEYFQTLKDVRNMMKLGLLSPDDEQKVYIATRQRQSRRDRFRYKSKKFTRGTAATDTERMRQQAINREYSSFERALGTAWEKMTYQDNIITSRFVNNVTPIDVYRKYYVYGNGPIRRWEHPYRDFIKPYTASALNRPSVTSSTLSMGTAGMVFGGPLGGGLGAMAGAVWGVVHGKEEVPEFTRQRSEIMKQIDDVSYIRAKRAMAAGDASARNELRRTMTYAFNNDVPPEEMVMSLPRTEREFVNHFVRSETVEERERIMQLVPDYARHVLQRAWSTGAGGYRQVGVDSYNPLQDVEVPERDWAGYDPSLDTKDVSVKMLDSAGIEARGVGLGFQSQRRRMLRNPYLPDTFDVKMKTTTPNTNQLSSIVQSFLPGAQVSVMPTQTPGIKLIVTGMYNNKEEQRNSMRQTYGI